LGRRSADTYLVKPFVNSQVSPHHPLDQIDDAAVRALVTDFMDRGGYGARMNPWPASELALPWYARGQCVSASDALVAFAVQAGFRAWRPVGYRLRSPIDRYGYWDCERECEITPEAFGYTDRLNRGYPSHYWACIEHDGHIWGIDLTAAQYGYSGPLAKSCPSVRPELWAQDRIWQPQLPKPLTVEDIIANRRAAGIDPYALNPVMVQLWDHPDGRMRYARSYSLDDDNVSLDPPRDADFLLDQVAA
jgi:hypothetical protein